jgi:cytochrome c oxidase subunit II
MKKTSRKLGLLAVLVIAVSMLLLAIGCKTSFTSNGQRIYFTAASSSGERITYTGGPGGMMQGPLACVNCHGSEGRGGTVNFMMQTSDVPDITWPTLTGQYEDHQPFTEETVKQAIAQGVDPASNSLEYPMPRWQMSTQDLNDLVAFIKTLN